MALQIRRGLEASRTSITPAIGEMVYTTDTKKVYIGDGTTLGGNAVGGGTVTNPLEVGLGLEVTTELTRTIRGPTNQGSFFTGFSQGPDMVANGDTYVAVSVYQSGATTGNTVSVNLYHKATGVLHYQITNPNPDTTSTQDRFGFSIAISGNYLVVGSPYEDEGSNTDSGKVYVYNISTFTAYSGTTIVVSAPTTTIANPNATSTVNQDYFGSSVAVSSSYIVVGAPNEETTGTTNNLGVVYIFNLTGTRLYTLLNPNTAYATTTTDKLFGTEVSISGNILAVGAPQDDTATTPDSGAVFIYNISTFTTTTPATIGTPTFSCLNPNPINYAYLGLVGSLATTDSYVIASAVSIGPNTTNRQSQSGVGVVYVWNASTGALLYTLTSPTIQFNARFGQSVSASGTLLAVGEPWQGITWNGDTQFQYGKVWIFDLTTGTVKREFFNPNTYGGLGGDAGPGAGLNTSLDDRFGTAVSLNGTSLAASAPYEDNTNANENYGAVYLYTIANTFNGSQTNAKLSLQKILPYSSQVGGTSGSTLYVPVISIDQFGRVTGLGQVNYSMPSAGLSSAYTNIYVNGSSPSAFSAGANGNDTINFVGTGGTTITTSYGSYKTITINSTVSSGGGGGALTWLTTTTSSNQGSTTITYPTGIQTSGNRVFVAFFGNGLSSSWLNYGTPPSDPYLSWMSAGGMNWYGWSASTSSSAPSSQMWQFTNSGHMIYTTWIVTGSGMSPMSGGSSGSSSSFSYYISSSNNKTDTLLLGSTSSSLNMTSATITPPSGYTSAASKVHPMDSQLSVIAYQNPTPTTNMSAMWSISNPGMYMYYYMYNNAGM
jgi:hypothetical protein